MLWQFLLLQCGCFRVNSAAAYGFVHSWHEGQTPYRAQLLAFDCTAARSVLYVALLGHQHVFLGNNSAACSPAPALHVDTLIAIGLFSMACVRDPDVSVVYGQTSYVFLTNE